MYKFEIHIKTRTYDWKPLLSFLGQDEHIYPLRFKLLSSALDTLKIFNHEQLMSPEVSPEVKLKIFDLEEKSYIEEKNFQNISNIHYLQNNGKG